MSGVDDSIQIDTSVRYNPTGIPQNAAIERLTAKTPLTLALKQHLPSPIRDPLYAFAMRLRASNRGRPPMNSTLRRRLMGAFREDTLKLAEFLDRDLSPWLDPKHQP